MEGARIAGSTPSMIEENSIITPITMTLFHKHDLSEGTLIHIPEAVVSSSSYKAESLYEIGISFKTNPKVCSLLKEYIAVQTGEDSN